MIFLSVPWVDFVRLLHFACQEMSHYVKLEKTDFVSSFWVRKCERGNGGMGTGIAATGTEWERDSVLRERDGSGT